MEMVTCMKKQKALFEVISEVFSVDMDKLREFYERPSGVVTDKELRELMSPRALIKRGRGKYKQGR